MASNKSCLIKMAKDKLWLKMMKMLSNSKIWKIKEKVMKTMIKKSTDKNKMIKLLLNSSFNSSNILMPSNSKSLF